MRKLVLSNFELNKLKASLILILINQNCFLKYDIYRNIYNSADMPMMFEKN